jgi:GT2 family glycosyltransferase
MDKISVVISTYNRPSMLYRTLYRLFVQKDTNYEVIVSVDDNDPNDLKLSLGCIAEFKSQGMPIREFETWKYKRGIGWSVETYPLNVGIKNATGEIILLNSADTMSITNTISQHRQVQRGRDNLAAVSLVWSQAKGINNDSYDWKNKPFLMTQSGMTRKVYTGKSRPRPLHFLMSIRKKWLEQIRGFDEDFYGAMPYGDNDLQVRLSKVGVVFDWFDQIVAVHQWHGPVVNPATKNPNYRNGADLFLNWRQHLGPVRNVKHEWGQYPRDMEKLPVESGAE